MTIAIAVTLPDGVLLVADGKINKPFTGEIDGNDQDKIKEIKSSISAIELGVTYATNAAVIGLQSTEMDLATTSPETFLAELRNSVVSGWRTFIDLLAPDVDQNNDAMRAALVAGGIVAGVPFVGGVLCGNGQESSVLCKGPETHFVVLGGEQQNAQQFFERNALEALQSSAWLTHEGPMNDFTKALLDAAVDTIKMAEQADRTIGGTIRYQVIRNNFQPLKVVI
jgi:hypothetical protein